MGCFEKFVNSPFKNSVAVPEFSQKNLSVVLILLFKDPGERKVIPKLKNTFILRLEPSWQTLRKEY